MDMGKASIILLRGLFGLLFLALELLSLVFVGKGCSLLLLILVLWLLCCVFGEKPKTILPWLAKTLLLGLAGLVLALGLLFLVNTWRIYAYVPDREPMFTSTSPSGRFTVLAYPSPTIYWRFAMPGQGSDGPALFMLRDNRTGKVLRREHVDGPWYVYTDVDWYEDRVHLARGDGIDWRLPPDESAR
jgi:hypothetical protein